MPAESLTPTPSGISTLNQMKSVFLATGAFSLLSLLGALPPPDALPPQPTRANAAKRAMQRERIDRVFFFMVASSLSADDIMAPHAVGVLIALAADVSVYCAAYASVHRLWPLRGRSPTGSLLIDMPQHVLPGSLERWAICPMFGAGAWDGTARHRLFHVAQQRPGWGRIDLAVTKAKPRKVERCSVKNADSKCLMDRRFVRIAGRRLRVAPRRHLQALVLPLPRA